MTNTKNKKTVDMFLLNSDKHTNFHIHLKFIIKKLSDTIKTMRTQKVMQFILE